MSSPRTADGAFTASAAGIAAPPLAELSPSSGLSDSLVSADATVSNTLSPNRESSSPAQSSEPAPPGFITNRDIRSLFSNPQTEPIMERYYKLTRHTFQICLLGQFLLFFQLSHFDVKEAWYNFRHPILFQRNSLVPFIVVAGVYLGGINLKNPNKRFDMAAWVNQRGWVIKPPTPSPDVLENLARKRGAHANINEAETEAVPQSSAATPAEADIRPTASLLSAAQTAALIAPVAVFNNGFHMMYGIFTYMWALDLFRHVQKLEIVSDEDRNFALMTIVSESIMVAIGLTQLVILVVLTKRIRAMLDHELLLKRSAASVVDDTNRVQREEV